VPPSGVHARAVGCVELEVGVAPVGEVAEESGGEVAQVGTQGCVELGPEIRERAVELLVQSELDARGLGLPLALRALGPTPDGRIHRLCRGRRLPPCADQRELGVVR
jgi:hypothetical protein